MALWVWLVVGVSSDGAVGVVSCGCICTSVLMFHLIYHIAMETEELAKKARTARLYPPTHYNYDITMETGNTQLYNHDCRDQSLDNCNYGAKT